MQWFHIKKKKKKIKINENYNYNIKTKQAKNPGSPLEVAC